jgi:subtilisin family serine protease
MKILSLSLSLIFIANLTVLKSLSGQILHVNKNVSKEFGLPVNEIDWITSAIDRSGNLITVGNTILSPNITAVFISKHDNGGNLIWQDTFAPPSYIVSKSYGISVITDTLNNIYIAAATKTGSNLTHDYLLLSYTSIGNLRWDTIYNGSDNLEDWPTSIKLNGSGELFVTGTSTHFSTLSDIFTIKINPLNGSFIWSKRVDISGNFDAAVDMDFDVSDNPVLLGLSGSGFSDIKIVTLKHNRLNGNVISQTLINNNYPGSTGSITPKVLSQDGSGNFIIASEIIGTDDDKDILLIKLNDSLQLDWQTIYDFEEEAESVNSITTDDSGNIIIAGSSKRNDPFTDLLIVKFSSNGVKEWDQKRTAEKNNVTIVGKQVIVLPDTSLYVLGEYTYNNTRRIHLLKLNKNGLILREDRYPTNCLTGEDHEANRMAVYPNETDGPKIVVLSKNRDLDDGESSYNFIEFQTFSLSDESYVDSVGNPICKKGEIVVKFNPDYVLKNQIDNLDLTYGSFTDFLNDEVTDALEGVISVNREKLVRIFNRLRTTDTISTSRLGEQIRIPEFWSSLIMTVPKQISFNELLDVCTDLENLKPYVLYAHPNYITTPANNCPAYGANDYLYYNQQSLHKPFPGSFYDDSNCDINVENAWGCSIGSPAIKVGIYDRIVNYAHEDFEYNNLTGFSAVKGGWDFDANVCLFCNGLKSFPGDHHGTKVAGIIGAIRNNSEGVAGIAGGNWSGNPGSEGVSLYSMVVMSGNGPYINGFTGVAEAIVKGAAQINDPCCVEEPESCFQLDIMNHSHGGSGQNDAGFQLLEDAVHFAFQNQVISVAARHNFGSSTPIYPACFDDSWIINVPAVNYSGDDKLLTSSYGNNVDVCAPGDNRVIYTLSGGGNQTSSFEKTSAATPHVSGVAALMLSIGNISGNIGTGASLAPEDIEQILERSARDIIADPNNTNLLKPVLGYDILTGYGLVDAGEAINDLSMCSYFHFGTTNLSPSWQSELVETNVPIQFEESFTQTGGPTFFKGTAYKADIYKISGTFTHNLIEVVEISWPRPSSSNTFPIYFNENNVNYIKPHEWVEINSINSDNADLFGFAYRIKDVNGNLLGFAPFDPANLANCRMAYTVRTCGVVSNLDPSEKSIDPFINIYPNPASETHRVLMNFPTNTDVNISLFDSKGRLLRQWHLVGADNLPSADFSLEVPIGALQQGAYFYQIESDYGLQHIGFFKI